MAKVQWSVLITNAIGSAGAVAATEGRWGPVIRQKSALPLRASIDQQTVRQAFASTAQLWRHPSMSPYRAGWILLAVNHPEPDVFGNLIKKTGLQWFTRANKTRDTFGLDPILPAPAFATVTDPAAVTVSNTGGGAALDIDVSTPPNGGTEAVIIKATRGTSPGRTGMSNSAKIVKTLTPGNPPPWDILTDYTSKFGAPIDGLQIFAQVYYVNIGAGYPGLARLGGGVW